MPTHPRRATLDLSRPIVLDGALATELEKKGCTFTDSLWSARILLEAPEKVYDVHYDYFEAGARCAITASYQATPQRLKQHNISHADTLALIAKSVQIAQQARDDFIKKTNILEPIFIAGSVGSYGAYLADGSEYTGDYQVPVDTLVEFHRERFETLLHAGSDIIAFETQANYTELEALIKLLSQYPEANAWIAFTVRDAQHLSDGTPLEKVTALLNKCDQIVAYGPNCIPLHLCNAVMEKLSETAEKPIVIYPNAGEIFNKETRCWEKDLSYTETISSLSEYWIKLGARIIGGCCRTSPEEIKKLAAVLDRIEIN